MNRIATGSARAYRSKLREQQADETRRRILDATLRVMAGGIATVSIPTVAREAGVSVPTIYRHFGTKRDLLGAVYAHVVSRNGLGEWVAPRSISEFRDAVHALFDRLDSADDLARAAMASPAAEEARRLSVPRRVALGRQLADSIVPRLAEGDRDRIARLLVVVTTSSALRVWRGQLGSSVDEAVDDIDWVISAAIAASKRKN